MILRPVSTQTEQEKAFVFGLFLTGDSREQATHSLEELERLVTAAGASVQGQCLFRQERIDAHAGLTRGHVSALAAQVAEMGAGMVVADFDLKPAQAGTLEKAFDAKVLDRTQIILDIFAIHARTEQAKCQVELAQLEYDLPRLPHLWTHLSRMEGGIGMRGPGEKQIETDRRLMRHQIAQLKKRLSDIAKRREVSSRGREEVFKVSLVGYTNAGKSSLLNALSGSEVLVRDQPFSTLDATSRAVDLPKAGRIVLTDTVGFIRQIPHHLITSFHATLAETFSADLLIHVVDASAVSPREERETVAKVLSDLGCGDKPRLVALNKMDRVDHEGPLPLEGSDDRIYPISCVTREGLPDLLEAIQNEALKRQIGMSILVPISRGDLLARIHQSTRVVESQESRGKLRLKVFASPSTAQRLHQIDGLKIQEI